MAKQYRTREGTVTAVNTKTALSTVGSETAPGPLLVPQGAKTLKGIITAFGCDLGVAADGGYLLRIEGSGLPEGSETMTVGASGVPVATGGVYTLPGVYTELNIPVTPANEILLFAENLGEDTGNTTVGATLVFAS